MSPHDIDSDAVRPKTPEERFQERVRGSGLLVRNPGELGQWLDVLRGFAKDSDLLLKAIIGFELGDGLKIVTEYTRYTFDVANRAIRGATERYEFRRKQFRLAKRARPHDRAMPKGQDLKGTLISEAWAETFSDFRDAVSLTPERLADVAGVTREVGSSFIRAFSTTFSGIEEQHLLLPSPLNPLIRTPIIGDDEGYYCSNPSLLFWAFLPRVADLLGATRKTSHRGKDTFHRYERAISAFMEKLVANLLEGVGASDLTTRALYAVDGADTNRSFKAEADIIGLIDRTLVIAECKASFYSDAALRGGEKSLASEVKRTVVEAQTQADRAAKAASKTSFQPKGGDRTDFRGRFDSALKLLVILDNAPVIASSIEAYSDLRLLGTAPGVPITLLDLLYATKHLPTAWAWKHYFTKRMEAIRDRYKTIAHDEEDFLAFYALMGRTANPSNDSFIHVASPNSIVDESKDLSTFLRLDETTAALIEALERSHNPHWTTAVGALIELRGEFTRRLASLVQAVQPGQRAALGMTADDVDLTVIPYRRVPLDQLRLFTTAKLTGRDTDKPMLIVYWDLGARSATVDATAVSSARETS